MPVRTLFDIFGTTSQDEVTTTQAPTEEAVRELAYHLWEEAGRPEGDGIDFWVRAEQELSAS